MSGEEPGYVPPDHKTTAEFGLPGKAAESETAAAGAGATFVDEPVGELSGATLQDVPEDDAEVTFGAAPVDDLPVDDAEDDWDVTFPDRQLDDEAPTVTDFPAERPKYSVTASDIPVPFPASAPPEAIEFEMPAPVYGEAPVPEQATEPEPAVPMYEQAPAELGEAGDRHITPPALAPGHEEPTADQHVPAAAPLASPPPPADRHVPAPASGEAPWTEQFSAESEPAGPGSAGPAFAYAMQAPPASQHEAPAPPAPPAAAPAGGVPPAGPPGSKRPLLLVALAAVVVLFAAAGVVVLFLIGGSEEDRPVAGRSPVASAPATGGAGEPAPVAPGEPTPSGAPAAPPSGAPSGRPPGQQPGSPPVPTAPIGPVRQGDGITYQLVQQDEGYFEGRMIITNRTDRPLQVWRLTFATPGADVKNVWGAKLVKRGERTELANLDGAPAIQPGATWDVQFGASGPTTAPQGCELNGKACGF